jgi:hypothetical protein
MTLVEFIEILFSRSLFNSNEEGTYFNNDEGNSEF